MAYFDCIVGGSGKGNTLVVTCADDLAGATITCTNGTKTYTKTCPSTAPYEVTFYGLEAGTWTVSATVSGNTYTTTVVITDYEAELGGFNWKAWVDLSQNYTSSDFTDLDDLLSDETAIRELMTIHACVDYLAEIAAASADVEQIIENDYCAKWINLRDYALDTLYANEIIAGYMDTADKYFYGEWVITDNTTTPPTWGPKGNVPVMTANNAPYGEANASSYADSSRYPAWKAFDGISSVGGTDMWNSANGSHTNQWIYFKFPHPVCIKKVIYASAYAVGYTPKNIIIQGSNDGTYKDLKNFLGENTTSDQTIDVSSNDEYFLYGRFYITDSYATGTMNVIISKLQFYGRELSVSVPTMTTNTTPYGEVVCHATVGNLTSYPPYQAFNGNATGGGPYNSSKITGYEGSYIGYDFKKSIPIKMIDFAINTAASGSSGTLKIIASDDGITWTPLSDAISYIPNERQIFINPSTHAYKMYALRCESQTQAFCFLGVGLQFYGLDYSEKEFEQGTTKKWLYDHGVELEELTFSNIPRIYSGGGASTFEAPTKESDYIKIYASGSTNTHSAFRNTNTINLTNYSLVRASGANKDFSNTPTDNNLKPYIMVNTDGTFNDDSRIAFVSNPLSNPYHVAIDISSVNQSCYIVSGTCNGRGTSINELWLE